MPLTELTAQEIARIDAVSMQFENWLCTKLDSPKPSYSQASASPSFHDSDTLDVQSEIERLISQFVLDSTVTLPPGAHAENRNISDRSAVLVEELRRELLAVSEELIESRTLRARQPSSNQLTTPPGAMHPTDVLAASPGSSHNNSVMPRDSSHQNPNIGPEDGGNVGWLQSGMQIGPYLIDERIGRGGMGEVYRGKDLRLGREVAIKILVHEWAATPEHAERFDREARAVAALSHPNIVSLYDVGHHSGRPYAVMELLKGETLRDRLRRDSPFPPEQVRKIGAAAADALSVAHQAGIVHRDLKPENLFLTSDQRVKLLDFGLSRIYDATGEASDPTLTGVIMGTMGYLSPEQASGKRITSAADIFSLGCVLHECFYGFRPFSGETTNEVLAATINAEPRVDDQIAASAPALAAVISQCLEKSPEARPKNASLLAQMLANPNSVNEHSEPVEKTRAGAGATSTQAKSDKFFPGISRRRWLQGLGWSAASLAGAGALYGGFRWIYPQPLVNIRSIAVLPLSNKRSQPGSADGLELRALDEGEQIAAAIADQLTRIPDLRVVPFLPLRESPLLTQSVPSTELVREICDQLGVDALLMGSFDIDDDGFRTIQVVLIERQTASQVGRSKVRARLEESLIKQEQTAQKIASDIGRELIDYRAGRPHENGTYHCLVNGYSRMDSESVEALRDAIKCFNSAISQDEKFAEAYSGLALTSMILVSQVDFSERADLITNARDALRNALELGDDTGLAKIAESMLAWQVDWDFEKADRLFRAHVPMMPDNWVAQHEYSFFLASKGDLVGALRHAERAVGLDPTSTAFRVDAARLRWFAGDWESALSELRATAARATGKRLELVRGATLDLLESVGMWDQANALLFESSKTFSQDAYWQAREASLKVRPYGPYDEELNRLILRLRRGDELDEAWLAEIKLHRPPRLPFLLAAHPTLAPLHSESIFEEALVRI